MIAAEIKTQPCALDSERCILFTAVKDGNVLDDVMETLSQDDFYNKYYGMIFKELQVMHSKNLPVDELILSGRLEKQNDGTLLSAFDSILECIVSRSSIPYHIAQLNETRKLRDLIDISKRVQRDAFAGDISGSDLLESVSQEIFNLSDDPGKNEPETLSGLMGEVFENISKRAKGEISGIPTGYQGIDDALGGFNPEDLIIVACRPGAGKTAIALNMLRHIVASNIPAMLFSLEMSKQQITERFFALEGDLSVNRLKIAKDLTKTEFSKLGYASGKVAGWPLVIDDNPGLTVSKLLSKARKAIRLHGVKLIAIDYLGLMHTDSKHANRVQQIGEISRGLKLVAKTLKIPVVALSQLSRSNVTGKEIRRPRLSDLRDSGSIEQDADIVLFVHREELEEATAENRGKAEIIIGKNRNGPCGILECRYIHES